MQQIFNKARGLWEIALDNGVILSHPSLSLLNPNAANGFVVFTRVGHTNDYCAYEVATGQLYPVVVDVQCGGWFSFIADARFLLIGVSFKQGKHSGPGELCVMIFDAQAKLWLDFAGQPTLNLFHPIGNPARTRCLWIKNANQANGFENTNPQGQVIDHKFLSANRIQYNCTSGFWMRDINMGALGPTVEASNPPVI